MAKKYALLLVSLVLIVVVVVVNLSVIGEATSVSVSSQEKGVVDKAQGGAFTVKIVFKNTGKVEGTWSVNVVFEGESWMWKGEAQNVTLKSEAVQTLTWNGNVPANATINSVSRLVVYYGDNFKALDWWIHVVPGAELSILSSNVS